MYDSHCFCSLWLNWTSRGTVPQLHTLKFILYFSAAATIKELCQSTGPRITSTSHQGASIDNQHDRPYGYTANAKALELPTLGKGL
jgi:hypothetical protein